MSKTSKTEHKNKENDLRKGKRRYQERIQETALAEKEIKFYHQEVVNYEEFFDDVSNKLL